MQDYLEAGIIALLFGGILVGGFNLFERWVNKDF